MLHYLLYLIIAGLTFIISRLPFRIVYLLSDILFFLIYYLIGYRKAVVSKNLSVAFPEKSKPEIRKIRKEFFKHFIDIFLEMIKTFNISKKEISKRFELTNPEEFIDFCSQNEKIIMMSSHYANFEWLMTLNHWVPTTCYGVYKKVNNKYLDRYIVESRSRFNAVLLPTKVILSKIENEKDNDENNIYAFLNDQSPKLRNARHWVKFCGVDVPVYTGAEMLAKKYNYPVAHFITKKVKRGHYQTRMEILTERPRELPDYEITDRFFHKLEESIRQAPAYYFWTHKRFKHMGKEPT